MRNLNNYIAMLFVVLLLGSSCKSVQKSIYNGDYNYAINKLEKKLSKKQKDEHILLLEDAYAKALENDIAYISSKNDNPYNWKTVINSYSNLDARQTKLKRYLPLRIKSKNRDAYFKLYDFKAELAEYKKDVSKALYQKATSFLSSGNKIQARNAYDILRDIKQIDSNYKDVNRLLFTSSNNGKNNVFVNVENKSGAYLPPALANEITRFTVNDLNEKWLTFHNTANSNVNYDYEVNLVLNEIFVLPPVNSKKVIEQKARVKDGWEYVLDKHGNVKKDSLGNDIKRDKFKWVYAKVGDNIQQKQATIAGMLYIVNLRSGQMVKNYPISGNSLFENRFFDFIGDERAISAAYKKKIKNTRPIPFPNDIQLLSDANELLQVSFKESIDRNSNMVLN